MTYQRAQEKKARNSRTTSSVCVSGGWGWGGVDKEEREGPDKWGREEHTGP